MNLRRNDAESINRHLDDTMSLGRAHSIGHTRWLLHLLGFELTVNSLALHRPREGEAPPLAARHTRSERKGEQNAAQTRFDWLRPAERATRRTSSPRRPI